MHHTIVNTYILDFARDSTDVLCNSQHPEDGRLRPKNVGAYIERIYNVCAFRCINTKQAHSAVSNVTSEDQTEVHGSYSEPHLESVENDVQFVHVSGPGVMWEHFNLCPINIVLFTSSRSYYGTRTTTSRPDQTASKWAVRKRGCTFPHFQLPPACVFGFKFHSIIYLFITRTPELSKLRHASEFPSTPQLCNSRHSVVDMVITSWTEKPVLRTPALTPTQPPIQLVPVFLPGGTAAGA
jgi:hypothetical protein